MTIDLKDAYFHIEILPQHRKFLRFAFGGEAYQYQVLPFGLALSPRTYTKCMDAALTPGHLHFKLQRRLADSGTVSRACASTSRCRPSSSRISGVETQRQEKRSLSCSEDNVFGGCMGFNHDAGTAVSCTHQIHSKCPKEHQARPENYCSLPSEGSRSHGSCIQGDTLGPPAYEIVSVVAQSQGISSKGQSPEANKGYAPGASYPFYVVQTPVSDFGSHSRSVLSSQDANDRRFPHGLGCGLGWPSSPRDLERPSSRMAHQLPRNDGSISALKYFLQQLRGYHVLVRVDNMAVVSYINHQGGLRWHRLNRLAQQVLLWAQDKFLSLRAIYIPGHMNVGADLLSRQAVTHGEWKLHPEVVSQIWERFYEAEVDLFASQETAQCPLYFSLTPPAPLGLDAMAHTWWPRRGLYAFPPIALLPGVLAKVHQRESRLLLIAPRWLTRIWFSDLISLLDGSPWAIPVRRDLLYSGTGDSISSPARALEPLCLAPEGDQLRNAGLPPDVVETILSARAPSTRRSYAFKWHIFENWCMAHHVDPVHCQVVSVLEFLQEKLSSGTCPGTLRIYVATISACHVLIDGVSVGKHPLGARFIRGAKRLRPPIRATVPSWDLAIVLEGLVMTPFEPLESAPIRFLTLKMFFLMAITSLKRIGDLQALSISPSCLDFAPGLVKVILHHHPNYLPKVPFSTMNPVVLEAFCPPPFTTPEQERLHLLCPVLCSSDLRPSH